MAKSFPRFIDGIGIYKDMIYINLEGTDKYFESIKIGEDADGRPKYKSTNKQFSYSELMSRNGLGKSGKDNVPAQENTLVEVKKVTDLIKGMTTSLSSLPSDEDIDRLLNRSRSQILVGEMVLPTLMKSLETISASINSEKLEGIEKSLGATAVETQRSRKNILEFDMAQSRKSLDIANLEAQLHSLDPESPEYTQKFNSINSEITKINQDFNARYPVPPEKETEIKYVVMDRMAGITSVINSMVSSVNKVAGIKIDNPRKTTRNIKRIGDMVTRSYDTMVRMVVDAAKYIGNNDIDSALGWVDSGISEYVMYEKPLPDGGTYKEYLTKKEFDKYTGENEDVKIKNVDYIKPHFAAEDSIFRIGEFISKMVDPIQKVSSIDLKKMTGPIKLRMNMHRLANSMQILVTSVVKEFSKINTTGSKEAISVLIGDQGEERIIDNIKTLSRPETNSYMVNQSTEKVTSGKKTSVVDVMSAFIDSCIKITSFDFSGFLKKSAKFRILLPIVGKMVSSISDSIVSLSLSGKEKEYSQAKNSIMSMNSYIDWFNENALAKLSSLKLPIEKIKEKRKDAKQLKNLIGGTHGNTGKILNKVGLEDLEKGLLDYIRDISDIISSYSENGSTNSNMNFDKETIKSGSENIEYVVESISDTLDAFKKLNGDNIPRPKNIRNQKILFLEALSLIKTVTESVSEYSNDVQPFVLISNLRGMSDMIYAIEPGMEAVSRLAKNSSKIKYSDISSIIDIKDAYVGFMSSGENLVTASNQISEILTMIPKIQKYASKVDSDNSWIVTLFGENGTVSGFIKGIVSVLYDIQDKNIDYSNAKKIASDVRDISIDILALMSIARLFSVFSKKEVSDKSIENTKRLVKLAIAPMEAIGEEKTYDTIKTARKSIVVLATALLILAGTISTITQMFTADRAKEAGTSFAAMSFVSFGSVGILSELSKNIDVIREGAKAMMYIAAAFLLFSASILLLGATAKPTATSIVLFSAIVVGSLVVLVMVNAVANRGFKDKNGNFVPDICKPLLAIAGSFMMFSLSILLLGLTNEPTMESMVGFVTIVTIAIVTMKILSNMQADVVKGALSLLLIGAALVALSGAMAVFSIVSESSDSLEMIKMAGVIVTLIGVTALAGLLVVPIALGAASMVLISIGMLAMCAALAEMYAVSKKIEDPKKTIDPVIDTIKHITRKISQIDMGTVAIATTNSVLMLVMMASFSLVVTMVKGLTKISPDPSDVERIKESMVTISSSLNVVSKELSKIGVVEIGKAALVSLEALAMLTSLSIVALILFGLSRLRVPTSFDKDNKPTAWENLNGSSFNNIGDAMTSLVSAIDDVVEGLSKIRVIRITKSLVVAMEALGLVASVSGMLCIMSRIGTRRIPVKWDEKTNKPVEWETIGPDAISRSREIVDTLIQNIDSIAEQISGYDTAKLKKASKNADNMRSVSDSVSSMLNIVNRLTSGPIAYGDIDDNGNLKSKSGTITGSIGDYLHSHSKQVEDNVSTLISIMNTVAEMVSGDDGIGNVNKSTIKKAKKNIKVVGEMMGVLQPVIDFVLSLTSGEFEIKKVADGKETIEKVNLGTFIKESEEEIKDNIYSLFGLVNKVGEYASDFNANVRRRDLRKADNKLGRIGEIIDSINPAIDLIMKLSDGEFPVEKDDGTIEKVNLGKYITSKRSVVEGNIAEIIDFIKQIAKRAAELGTDGESKKRDIKNAGKKAGLIGGVLDTMMDTIEIIEKLASGTIQIGIDDNGSPIMQSMEKFLSESSEGINENIRKLIDFIIGPNGIQSHLDKITGEKSNTAEKKKNSIEVVSEFTSTISSIIDLTKKMGEQIDDPKTKDLFGTDTEKNMSGRLGRLMEGYSVPLKDDSIFSKSDFKKRFNNLTEYDKLMKKIMDVKHVDNYERSVKATGDMVNSINSINDSKIDKLNKLMENMTEFGKTVDEALKDTFDKITELAEELHYVIEANDKKSGNTTGQVTHTATGEGKQKQQVQQNLLNQPSPQPQQISSSTLSDISDIEAHLSDIKDMVKKIIMRP